MNRLTPELKRIIHWARQAPRPPEPEPPLGFSRRVVQAWLTEAAQDPLWAWQCAVWRWAWAAAAVILLGLGLLTAQRSDHSSAYDVSPAYEVVSTQLVP